MIRILPGVGFRLFYLYRMNPDTFNSPFAVILFGSTPDLRRGGDAVNMSHSPIVVIGQLDTTIAKRRRVLPALPVSSVLFRFIGGFPILREPSSVRIKLFVFYIG